MKKRVSICGVKRTVEVPEGYNRVFEGRLMNGDLWYGANGKLVQSIKHANDCISHIEDGWECIFRKIEDLPEQKEIIDIVIILVIL